jgi:hypothetical protein
MLKFLISRDHSPPQQYIHSWEQPAMETVGQPAANAKHGQTSDRSCVKMAALLGAPISLLQATQGEGIRVASFIIALGLGVHI